nr:SGNH/GDSL hydrolase family protein [uncultured Psychroserpens sp.]
MNKTIIFLLIQIISFLSCSVNDDNVITSFDDPIKILNLGDSYTIGQSVCDTCRFPEQLKSALNDSINKTININVIAQTGWTTTNLINTLEDQSLQTDYDLATLLIGVNNQYQNIDFLVFEAEFPQLLQMAINAIGGDKSNLIVLSIPDYAFTTFGQNNGNPETTSEEINMYNDFIESYCQQEDITFLNITDITRQGLEHPNLVAIDGLHPSELAYTKFVERLLPITLQKIE